MADVKRGLLLLLSCAVLIALLYWVTVWYTGGGNNASSATSIEFGPRPRPDTDKQQFLSSVFNFEEEPPRPSRFLYLSQTEVCLPNNLLSNDVIGNTTACQCDVLVLSYKKKCSKNPNKHVKYLFNSSTSWASGRNFLYENAKKRGEVYLFYIFLDDDITLTTKTPNANPWREFEDFLQQIEPAIAAIDTDTNGMLKPVLNGRKQKGCPLNPTSNYKYIPTARFDPAINAYHCKAAKYILPYTTLYDKTSWWYPDLYFEIKCELTFAGQIVLHTRVTARNPKHRPYPRGNPNSQKWATMVSQVAAELPERYRNSSLLSEWKRDMIDHRRKSSTLCLSPPPPHLPIKPFAYLDNVS
jgi:hypothetical protein